MSNLSIVIPVYNEDETCELFVDVLEATVKTPHEVIIVYDSLNDTTIPSINNLKKKYNNIYSVFNNEKKGAVNAFKKGLESSKSDIVLLSTIDEIFPIIIIDEMYDLINIHDCDMVSGTRYKFGGKRYGGFFIGKNLSRLANLLFNFITNFPLSDSTTGFKMFKKKFFENIKIESRPIGWAFAFEMAIKFSIEGAKFGEVPLIAVDRVFGGKSTFKGNAKRWTKEYFRWFWWGIKNKNNLKINKIKTIDKYLT